MSEIYATGDDGPVHPDRARPGRRSSARSTAGSPTSSTPTTGIPVQRHLRELRQDRHDDRDRLGRRAGLLRVPRTSSTWAHGLRHGRAGSSPFGGRAKLALEPRVGGAVEPVRRHDRAVRQGPRDGRRRRATARDAIAREVFEREPPLNVPTSSSTSAARRCRPRRGAARRRTRSPRSCRPSSCASCSSGRGRTSAIEFDPDGTDAIPRLFDEFDRIAAATAGREVQGRAAAGSGAIFALLAPRPGPPTSRRARAAFRPRVRAPRAPRPGAGRRRRGAVAAEKGAPLTAAEAAIARRAGRRRAALARDVRAGAGADRGPGRRAARRGATARRAQRAFLGASADRAPTPTPPAAGERLAGADLRRRPQARDLPPAGVRRALRRLPRPRQRPARRLAAGEPRARRSWSIACVEAAAAAVRVGGTA